MQVVLYENGVHDAGKKLWNIIGSQVDKAHTERFTTLDSFSQELRQPMNGISIAILLAPTKHELLELISLQELMDNIQVILVLADRNADTLSLGRHIRNSFISDVDSDLSDVGSVLKQILKNKRENI